MKTLLSLLALLTVLPATVWAQAPAGSEFQVNAYTTGAQRSEAVAVDGSGNFVVVWMSYGQDGDGYGIFGRRFNASGAPQGAEFQVNSYTTNFQYRPGVASDASGNFVVIWESFNQDGPGGWGVFGQRFNAAGVPQGSYFQVNSYTTGNQRFPRAAVDASGNFVVVWTSYGQDDGTGVFGQRFNASGVRQGGEFQLNAYTTGFQSTASAAVDGAGNFVVVWSSRYQDGANIGVIARRYNASGVPQGNEFVVNTFTTGDQATFFSSSVASDPSGNFVVVWRSGAHDGDSSVTGIFGQRFDASGTPQGGEFLINTYTPDRQTAASVAMDEHGSFVVVWSSRYQDGSNYGTFGQRFDPAGVPQGSEFQINSFIPGLQFAYGVASSPDGDFVVGWHSFLQDGDNNGVFAQRYGDIIFEDGVDSGDLTRWSSSSTDGGDLSASGAAAMAGTSFGLQAAVNDTNSLFVQDDTPDAEAATALASISTPTASTPARPSRTFAPASSSPRAPASA